MTLKEAIECGKKITFPPKPTMIGANDSIDDLPRDEITRLFIKYEYEGTMPNLALFPNLREFTSTIPVTMEYIAQQDLTKLQKLTLWFTENTDAICILAPALEELAISIHGYADTQLSLFDTIENTIFIANMPNLKQLRFGNCLWHKIIVAGTMPSVEKVVFYNQDIVDLSILNFFPNIKELVVTGCSCTDVTFAKALTKLEKLDVSYNLIRDFTPLLDLPHLKEINVRRNPPSNASLLLEKGCKVILDDADYGFEQFKWHLTNATWRACSFVEQCRKHNPKRHPLSQRRLDQSTDEELFLWNFTQEVKREINIHDPTSEKNIYYPIPKEKMLNYVRETYPFVEL